MLEFGSGLFASLTLAGISRNMCFGRAEGLPGQAWDEGRPILLKQFIGSNFRRTAAARAAGLGSAVAVPMFAGERLTSVLVFFCGDDTAERGAIELWRNDPRVTTDMTLVDGRYGAQAGELEALSRETFLPRGTGLPGLAWQRGGTVYNGRPGRGGPLPARRHRGRCRAAPWPGDPLPFAGPAEPCADLPRTLRHCRSPCGSKSGRPTQPVPHLRRGLGFCEAEGPLTSAAADVAVTAGEGCVARAFRTGVPALTPAAASEPGPVGVSAGACRADALVALPIVSEGEVVEVLALYF